MQLWFVGAVVLGLVARAEAQVQSQSPQTPAQAQSSGQTCPGQDVATHQTSAAFSSIGDGQPNSPRQAQLNLIPSYNFGEDEFQDQTTLTYVGPKSGFWCQAEFGLTAPTLVLGDALADFERSISPSWQQRWHVDNGRVPTISTLVAIQVPYDEPGEKTDLVLTGIVVKSASWGAGYLNVFAETSGGIAFDNFAFGGILGVKGIVTKNLALFADVVIQEHGAYSLEFSMQGNLPKGWSLGPGVSLSHPGDGDDELDVALGINIAKTFGG